MLNATPSDLFRKNPNADTQSNATISSASQVLKGTKLPPNAKVVGNYLLGKNIGQGTFGKVHIAIHLPTGEKVAIKIVDKKSMRPKDVIRVKSEIAILSSIRHRNILHLYQIIETEKSLLLVTEFLEGGELFRQIIKDKKFSEEQACSYFQQLISGVQYLHRNRIAHRDLKPQNILIDYDGQIKIIDFGLSNLYGKNKELKSSCGSPCYVAPEIIEAKGSYNPLFTDLWSCGVILFAMLCGYLPFCDPDTNTLFKKIIACNYKIPSHVSGAARDLIQNLLVKIPNKRMQINDIRNHEWFNLVPHSISYGINKNQKLKIDYNLVSSTKQFKISSEKLIQGLSNGQLTRQTATYFILMKKGIRSGQKIGAYIGSDGFDPSYIESGDKEQDNDTQIHSDLVTVVQSLSGPNMTDQSQELPASGNLPIFFLETPLQHEKTLNQEQVRQYTQSIFNLVMSQIKQEAISPFRELFQLKSSKKDSIDFRSDIFYQNNEKNKKGVTNLQQYKQILLQIVQINTKIGKNMSVMKSRKEKDETRQSSKSKNKNIRVRTIQKSGARAISAYVSAKRTSIQAKKSNRIVKDIEKLIETLDKRQAEKVLPYLTFGRNTHLREKILKIKKRSNNNTLSK